MHFPLCQVIVQRWKSHKNRIFRHRYHIRSDGSPTWAHRNFRRKLLSANRSSRTPMALSPDWYITQTSHNGIIWQRCNQWITFFCKIPLEIFFVKLKIINRHDYQIFVSTCHPRFHFYIIIFQSPKYFAFYFTREFLFF